MNKVIFAALCAVALTLSAKEWKDISYYEKDAPAQGNMEYRNARCKLDLYVPDRRVKFPTLVWLHGGGLKRGNKSKLPLLNTQAEAVATAVIARIIFTTLPPQWHGSSKTSKNSAATRNRSTFPVSLPAVISPR